MTQYQKALYALLIAENKQSEQNGEPFLRNPRPVFDEISKNTQPDIAKNIIKQYENGTLFPDEIPSETDKAGRIEIMLWLVYMNAGANWTIISGALAELIEQGKSFVKMAQNKAINALPALLKTRWRA